MRISMLAIMISVGAGSLMALPALTNVAWAVQDQPAIQNGIETVCTGVGSAKDNPAWSGYPVKLTFSNPAGEYESMEHVSITRNGQPVLETDCDAPWLLIKAPAGQYNVNASLKGSNRTASANFSTGGSGGQKTVNLAFPGGNSQAQNSFPADQAPAGLDAPKPAMNAPVNNQ